MSSCKKKKHANLSASAERITLPSRILLSLCVEFCEVTCTFSLPPPAQWRRNPSPAKSSFTYREQLKSSSWIRRRGSKNAIKRVSEGDLMLNHSNENMGSLSGIVALCPLWWLRQAVGDVKRGDWTSGQLKAGRKKHHSNVIKAALLIKEISLIKVTLNDDSTQRSALLCETFSYKWIGQTKGIIPT